MEFSKIMETCIYFPDLNKMKGFYQEKLGLELLSEKENRHLFFRVGESMLLIFNPEVTMNERDVIHGAVSPPSMIHFAFQINKDDFQLAKQNILNKDIQAEKEITWPNGGQSIYFRDPADNLVEIITDDAWPI
jgi:catechol 2,3-dioxygenase-like lactoylglutathione lyase family enzyme